MTQDEKYTEQFKKALNEYIDLGFNQDECNGFIHGFHKGAEAKQLILSGVVKSLKDKYEIVFEDWLKDHKFKQSNNGFNKNGIEYKVNEIIWMYIQDVYNL
tara:strand:+ start:42 stop:344 length:303 start_codon:yes stop_codon:yes gene_type:complete